MNAGRENAAKATQVDRFRKSGKRVLEFHESVESGDDHSSRTLREVSSHTLLDMLPRALSQKRQLGRSSPRLFSANVPRRIKRATREVATNTGGFPQVRHDSVEQLSQLFSKQWEQLLYISTQKSNWGKALFSTLLNPVRHPSQPARKEWRGLT